MQKNRSRDLGSYPDQQVVRVSRRVSAKQEQLIFESYYPAAAAEPIPETLAVIPTLHHALRFWPPRAILCTNVRLTLKSLPPTHLQSSRRVIGESTRTCKSAEFVAFPTPKPPAREKTRPRTTVQLTGAVASTNTAHAVLVQLYPYPLTSRKIRCLSVQHRPAAPSGARWGILDRATR
jgi:hypothetical protein